MENNNTFSIVYYEDGAVEMIAGDVAVKDGSGYKIINSFVLDYIKSNKVGVRYIEAGLTHLRIDLQPRFDVYAWDSKKQMDLNSDDFVNNYSEA